MLDALCRAAGHEVLLSHRIEEPVRVHVSVRLDQSRGQASRFIALIGPEHEQHGVTVVVVLDQQVQDERDGGVERALQQRLDDGLVEHRALEPRVHQQP